MKDSKYRIEYLDIAKGILIFLVVLGHVMPESKMLHIWIYSFHIPAFFIIDGFLLNYTEFENKQFQTIINKGIKNLIIPYVIYCIPLLVTRWIGSGFTLENLRFQIIDMIFMCGIGAMWFLPCLFLAQLWFYSVKYIVRKFNLRLVIIFISILCICIPSFINYKTSIDFVLFRSFVAVGFILLGDYIFSKARQMKNYSKLMAFCTCIVSFLVQVILFVITGCNDASLNVLRFGNIVCYIINAVLGTLAIVFISIYFSMKRLGEKLSYLGRNSLIIMGTHQLVMIIFMIPIIENYLINILLTVGIVTIECFAIKALTYMKGKVKVE